MGYYHEDRCATTEEKADIKRLLELGVPSGKIALNLHEQTGKLFKRYDIGNIGKT